MRSRNKIACKLSLPDTEKNLSRDETTARVRAGSNRIARRGGILRKNLCDEVTNCHGLVRTAGFNRWRLVFLTLGRIAVANTVRGLRIALISTAASGRFGVAATRSCGSSGGAGASTRTRNRGQTLRGYESCHKQPNDPASQFPPRHCHLPLRKNRYVAGLKL